MLKNRILYILGLVLALVFALFSWLWIAVFILAAALVIPIVSLLLTAGMVRKIKYSVVSPGRLVRGEVLNIIISDQSGCMVPDYIVGLELEESGGETSEWIAELNCAERRTIKLKTEHCGAVECRVKSAYALDYLGLFRLKIDKIKNSVTAVMPVPVPPEPLPVLAQIVHTSFRPKYGGGFSEVHDMREYRPGDSMRDVHWKLSAKTDRVIVREPQEPDRGIVLVTIDLMPASDRMDIAFDRLAWVSRWLCENEVNHEVRWIAPETREVKAAEVCDMSESVEMLKELLTEKVTEPLPSITNINFVNIDWHYHIGWEGKK